MGFVGLLAASAPSVFGVAVTPIYTLDERGAGTLTVLSNTTTLSFTVAPEPISGISTLVYTLPSVTAPGDILLQEVPGGPPSDILRFDGQGRVFFFSDGIDGIDGLADVLQLPAPIAPNLMFMEVGPEGGLNGYWGYTPVAGQPGFDPTKPGAVFNFISDVPEPTATALAGLGGLLMVLRLRHKARRQ